MFSLTPWYDELYTYYYFISRGPVYAAIHWPLPNNHVGYSVLSGFLNLLGNPTIGLRGVSYICALANLALLYKICRKSFSKGWSFCCVAIYSCMNLVNQLAVQGRGYTLAVTCFLTAVFMLQKIGLAKDIGKIKYYVIYSFSLTLGLYVLPSSVYWVIPVCITGGLFLLLYKKSKALIYLIVSSAVAAVNTVVLYAVIWLAIGSNLLSKAEDSVFFGQGHIRIICSAPFLAIKTGIGYMLATPYIQSVERKGYFIKFAGWLHLLCDQYYSHVSVPLGVVIFIGIIYAVICGIKKYKADEKECFMLLLFVAVTMILMPVMLMIQCSLPYFRVFSYMGIPISIMICAMLQNIMKRKVRYYGIPAAVSVILAIVLLLSKDYNKEYGTSEYYVRDAFSQTDIREKENLCVTDCYQQYLLKFFWNIDCESIQIEDSDVVLLPKEMMSPDYDGSRWEFYHTYDSVPWDYINEGMEPAYENEEYVLYMKK